MRWINNLKTTVLMASLMGLLMAAGYFVLGPRGVVLGFLLGGIGNFAAYYYSDKIALATMKAREVRHADLPWLVDMVGGLARRAGLPPPRVYICPHGAPNAFATGRDPEHAAIALTEGLLRNFPAEEIEGVIAHELAHVKHRDVLISTIAATLAGVISYAGYALMFMGNGRDRDNAFGAIAMMIFAPLAALLIQAAISRQREFAADSYGGELCGNPLHLAAALARLQTGNERVPTTTNPAFHNLYIMEPLSARGMRGLVSTHPSTDERIAALRRQAAERR